MARLQQRRGEYQDALDGYRRAVALLEPSGDDFWLASTLTGIADPGWQQAVQVAYRARRDNRLPSYRDSLQHNLGVLNPAVAEVLNELSDEQRARLARELGALRARLLQLSGRPLAT